MAQPTAQFLLKVCFMVSWACSSGKVTVDQLIPDYVGFINNSLTEAQPGRAVRLACPIPAEMFGTRVSWIRKKDVQLLSVGEVIYKKDNRLFVTHSAQPQTQQSSKYSQVWFLHMKNVTMEDEGVYECQTSTHPHVSFYTFLKVQKAYSVIHGPKERVVAAGSELHLKCDVMNSTSAPAYVFWYQDAKMVNYDAKRGINVSTVNNQSALKVVLADETHAGNYTCSPANTSPSSVVVHVIPETNDVASNKDQKRGVKTPVRQLGVKSPSSSSSAGSHASHILHIIFLLIILTYDISLL